MNPAAQQVAKRGMNQAVTAQPCLPGKSLRHDQQAVMSATVAGAGVTGVFRRIVDQFETDRRQGGESLADDCAKVDRFGAGRRVTHAGNTFLNGLTLTVA